MSGATSVDWKRRAAISAVALACIAPARAGPGLSLEATHGHYESIERLGDGTVANTESGRLEGGRAHFWWHTSPWRIGMALGHQEGRIKYLGLSQIGLPIRTNTRIKIDEAAVTGQWTVVSDTSVSVKLNAALGLRRIDRSIAASLRSTPLTEVMHWRFVQFGAQAHRDLGSGWFVGANILVEQGVGARLAIDFHGFADPVTVSPGSGRGHTIGMELGRVVGPGTTLRLQANSSRQRYGSSAWRDYTRGGLVAGQVRYPGSVQRLDSVRLVLTKTWD